jgi:hypothetical protein
MNKKGLSCLIIGFLLLTIIPMENQKAISVSKELSGDIYIESMEPIQVIEDADTLVTGKATVLRLIIQSTFSEEVQIYIEITYDLGSKTYLETGLHDWGIHIAPGKNTIYIPGGPADPGWNSTWNPFGFLRWTNIGIDSLFKAELDPDNLLEETDETNNVILNPPIQVANAPQLRVLYVPIAFPGDEYWYVDSITINKQKKFMLSTYPLSDSDLYFYKGPLWNFSESFSGPGYAFDNWFFEVVVYPIACTTRILGFNRVVIVYKGYSSGRGRAIGMIRNPEIREPVIVSPSMPKDNLIAHELGHTYYLWHPHDLGPAVYTDDCYNVLEQEYGENMNTLMSYRSEPHWIDKGRYDFNPKTLLSPGEYYYAGDPELGIEPENHDFTGTTYSWNLMDQLTEDPPTYSCLMIHGILRNDNTITLNHSWYSIEAIPDEPQQMIGGSQDEKYYFIVYLNDNQQITYSFPFKASFKYVMHDDLTGELEEVETETVPFLFSIPEKQGTRLIQLQDADGQVLAEREVTMNSPNVQVIHPNGGEEFKVGDKINIEWEGYDQDQDSLRYTIAYSNDSGQNWIPLVFDIKETFFEWNTFDQSNGEYLIKVIASDGVNVGEDISDGKFSLPRAKIKNHLVITSLLQRLMFQLPLLMRLLLIF